MKIAIIGAGKLGVKILEMLISGDHAITVVDKDEQLLQKLNTNFDIMTVTGNGQQRTLLDSIDIQSFDFLLAATDSDEKNIVIASFAKKLGCSKVIARIRDPEHIGQFLFIKETMGIDSIINPDFDISQEIYKYLVEKYTLSQGIFSRGQTSLLEFMANKIPRLINTQISEVSSILGHVVVVAVSRNGKVIIPHGSTTIQTDDIMYITGAKSLVNELYKKVHHKSRHSNLHNVMIAGGGKTGFYLARMLSEFGAAVKLIEHNKERCLYLASNLNNVLILYGDATDLDLLEEENFDEMDAFITTTGFDEENLLLALMAKKHGIEDVIAKISHDSYENLIESMGIDMILNPIEISATHALRYIQGSKIIISSQLIQGQAEMIEIIANKDMLLLEGTLSEIPLPDDVIIGSIQRGSETIIPTGQTQIEEGDIVIILSLLTEVPTLEKFIKIRKGFFK